MIFLGADHGGYHLKEKIKQWLDEWGYEWEDVGNTTLDPNDDYPEFAIKVAKKVAASSSIPNFSDTPTLDDSKSSGSISSAFLKQGILACRSAAGMVIAANKVKGVRAVAAFDEESARHSRINNDANVLAISGDWATDEEAKKIIKIWLDTDFSGEERHVRRLMEIEAFEQSR